MPSTAHRITVDAEKEREKSSQISQTPLPLSAEPLDDVILPDTGEPQPRHVPTQHASRNCFDSVDNQNNSGFITDAHFYHQL